MAQFSLEEFRELVAAVSVPMLVMDYRGIIAEYSSWDPDELEEWLQDPHHIVDISEHLGEHTASDAWIRLYGGENNDGTVPDLISPMVANPDKYADYHKSMIAEFTAPFKGIRSLLFEHTVPGPQGRDITVRSHWKAAGGINNPYARIVVVDLDVTDLRRTEQAAQESAESRSRILRTVGHELRDPLDEVSTMSDTLMKDWHTSNDKSRREMLKAILDQATDTMMGLEDLLAGAAAEQKALQVVQKPVDMLSLLTDADLKDFDVKIESVPSAIADPLRVRQIIRNLVQNARQHGGPKRQIRCFSENDDVLVQVIDNGEGIPESEAARLFETLNTNDESNSLNLGLSVSKSLAIAMEGDLTLRTDLPNTTFELRLPTSRSTRQE